jgi:hypothetical protein
MMILVRSSSNRRNLLGLPVDLFKIEISHEHLIDQIAHVIQDCAHTTEHMFGKVPLGSDGMPEKSARTVADRRRRRSGRLAER